MKMVMWIKNQPFDEDCTADFVKNLRFLCSKGVAIKDNVLIGPPAKCFASFKRIAKKVKEFGCLGSDWKPLLSVRPMTDMKSDSMIQLAFEYSVECSNWKSYKARLGIGKENG